MIHYPKVRNMAHSLPLEQCFHCFQRNLNKIIKMSSFESSVNIQKKEGGPNSTVSNHHFSSVTLNELAMNAIERAYYNFEFQ